MPDLRLQFLITARDYTVIEGEAVETNSVRGVAAAYIANMQRVDSLIRMFPSVFAMGVDYQYCLDVAKVEITGSMAKPESPEVREKIADRTTVLFESQRDLMSTGSEYESGRYLAFASDAEAELGRAGREVFQYLHPWLSALVVGTWTAVETLSGDLWEACVNTRPGQLSRLDGLPRTGGKSPGTNQERTISVNDLRRYNYDLRSAMGTILRRKFSFQTLDGIRRAYRAVFPAEAGDVLGAVTSTDLDELAVVRNLIVHRAGSCDPDYLSRAKGLPGIPQIVLGTPIPLDGQFVGGLIEKSFKNV